MDKVATSSHWSLRLESYSSRIVRYCQNENHGNWLRISRICATLNTLFDTRYRQHIYIRLCYTVNTYAYTLGIRICSIGRKFTMDIQVNITLPVFVFLMCFLALLESLKLLIFIMVVCIISLDLDEPRH